MKNKDRHDEIDEDRDKYSGTNRSRDWDSRTYRRLL